MPWLNHAAVTHLVYSVELQSVPCDRVTPYPLQCPYCRSLIRDRLILHARGFMQRRRKALGSVHPNFKKKIFLLLILILVVPSHADSFSIMHTAFVISSETSANQPIKSIEFQK